jgi:hypothetical protein
MAFIMSPVVWATGGAGIAGPVKAGNPMVCAAEAGEMEQTEPRTSRRATRRRFMEVLPLRLTAGVSCA